MQRGSHCEALSCCRPIQGTWNSWHLKVVLNSCHGEAALWKAFRTGKVFWGVVMENQNKPLSVPAALLQWEPSDKQNWPYQEENARLSFHLFRNAIWDMIHQKAAGEKAHRCGKKRVGVRKGNGALTAPDMARLQRNCLRTNADI